MKTFKVMVWVDYKVSETYIVEVEAENEDLARDTARDKVDRGDCDQFGKAVRSDLTIDTSDDVTEVPSNLSTFVKGAKLLSVVVVMESIDDEGVDAGILTLSIGQYREYKMDVKEGFPSEDGCSIVYEMIRYDEVSPECPYDLTVDDLMSSELKCEMFIESATEVESITMFVRIGGENGCTKAIDVTRES